MSSREVVTLSRDCPAVHIPDGTRVLLPAGLAVTITQSLGGAYTVSPEHGGLYRVDAGDADALGREAPTIEAATGPLSEADLEQRVWDQLRTCYDPEIPVNIVDLGLIYDCMVGGQSPVGRVVAIKMTLTAPGCGMGEVLAQDVKTKVQNIPGVSAADVEVVFDPPWNPSMMTEAARLQLGFF